MTTLNYTPETTIFGSSQSRGTKQPIMRQASVLNRMSVYPFLQLASELAVVADMPVGCAVQAIDLL